MTTTTEEFATKIVRNWWAPSSRALLGHSRWSAWTLTVYPKAGAQVIGKGRVWVPTQLYKLVYDAGTGRAWAHWVENENEARPGQPITYRDLVARTGIEFLPGINPAD